MRGYRKFQETKRYSKERNYFRGSCDSGLNRAGQKARYFAFCPLVANGLEALYFVKKSVSSWNLYIERISQDILNDCIFILGMARLALTTAVSNSYIPLNAHKGGAE